MAPSAQSLESAETAFNPHSSEDASDDWVSLMLSDVGLDLEEDSSLSLASLANFPLPDLEDMDFSNLDGCASHSNSNSSNISCFDHGIPSSFQEGQSISPSDPDVLFDPTQMLQESFPTSQGEVSPCLCQSADWRMSEGHACPNLCHPATFASPSFSQLATLPPAFCGSESMNDAVWMPDAYFQTVDEENGACKSSQSPESGLTQLTSESPDADINIPVTDSGSEEDNLYFLVSDICSEEIGSTELEHGSFVNASNTATHGGDSAKNLWGDCSLHRQVDMDDLQTLSNQQQFPSGFDNGVKSASVGKVNRKRKALDRKSRSSSPEETAVDSTEKLEDPFKEGEIKDEDDERRQARLMRNRESAQLSRQRKKIYVDELEEKIKTMASTIAELTNTINLISTENVNLRRQLGLFGPPSGQAGGIPGVAPWVGAYPPGHMVGGRFMVPGSQVPLVPIPRWKSQQATTVKKTKKSNSETQGKGSAEKASKRTKKVAGVAAAGLFFFVFILLPMNLNFLGLRPILHEESKVWPASPWHMDPGNMVVRSGGRVLTGISEGSDPRHDEPGARWSPVGNGGSENGENDSQARRVPEEWKTLTGCHAADMDRKVHNGATYERNGSVPLAAMLFVPRNDRLVGIEGNLIIHSVLAGNRAAVESHNQTENKSVRMQVPYDEGRAFDANLKAVAVNAAPEEKGALVELQRALAGRSRFDLERGGIRSVQDDGPLQQWFLEDLAGPVFSSGICTEVFQFETTVAAASPSPAASSHNHDTNDLVENRTARLQEHGPPRRAGRSVSPSRKSASYAVPLPPVGHKVILDGSSKNSSATGSTDGFETERDFGKRTHASSSVVVSVLAGSELGDQAKLIGGGKGLSQIFVVVLIDSVKYVTYSCMLPSAGSKTRYEMVVA